MNTLAKLWPYEVVGNRDAVPVVFLHGFMGRGQDWLPSAKALADSAYSIMPDLPGHAQNTIYQMDQPLSFDMLAEELANLLDHLELNTVNLVGYSMGGRLALFFGLRFPERVQRLVLESASAGIALEKECVERQIVDDQRAEQILAYGMQMFVDAWYQMPLFASLSKKRRLLERIKQTRYKNDPTWIAKVIRDLSPGLQPQVLDQLQSLKMPVLLMAGELDPKYTRIMKAMGESISGAQVITITGSGHNCHAEKPDKVVQHLAAFIGIAADYLTKENSTE